MYCAIEIVWKPARASIWSWSASRSWVSEVESWRSLTPL